MAECAELPKRKRKPLPIHHLPPNVRGLLLAEDVTRLRGRSEEMIRATLAVLSTFPSARLIQ